MMYVITTMFVPPDCDGDGPRTQPVACVSMVLSCSGHVVGSWTWNGRPSDSAMKAQ